MGSFTDDMTRLVGEIHAARDGRGRMMRDLKHATVEMKQAVAGMQTRVRLAHADMTRGQRGMLRDFATGLRATVAGMRREFGADLAGARGAWSGTVTAATPGRTRRGGKWFGGEGA